MLSGFNGFFDTGVKDGEGSLEFDLGFAEDGVDLCSKNLFGFFLKLLKWKEGFTPTGDKEDGSLVAAGPSDQQPMMASVSNADIRFA